jgi:hypothetical protein
MSDLGNMRFYVSLLSLQSPSFVYTRLFLEDLYTCVSTYISPIFSHNPTYRFPFIMNDCTSNSGAGFSPGSAREPALPKLPTDSQAGSTHVAFWGLQPTSIPPPDSKALKSAQADIKAFEAWILQLAKSSVDAKVSSGQIKQSDTLSQNNYRAKVMDWIINNKSTWLSKILDANQVVLLDKTYSRPKVVLSLAKMLNLSTKIFPELEELIGDVLDRMKATNNSVPSDKNMMWVMVTQQKFDAGGNGVGTIVQALWFSVVEVTKQDSKDRKKPASVWECRIGVSQYDFNHDMWRNVHESNQRQLYNSRHYC